MEKSGLKSGDHYAKKIKNITKIEQMRLLLFTFLISSFMGFLAQKIIYTVNIWFNFVFGSFFELDHLFNSMT